MLNNIPTVYRFYYKEIGEPKEYMHTVFDKEGQLKFVRGDRYTYYGRLYEVTSTLKIIGLSDHFDFIDVNMRLVIEYNCDSSKEE